MEKLINSFVMIYFLNKNYKIVRQITAEFCNFFQIADFPLSVLFNLKPRWILTLKTKTLFPSPPIYLQPLQTTPPSFLLSTPLYYGMIIA